MSSRHDELNRRGAQLLQGIAAAPGDSNIATEFNTLFYPVILQYVKRRQSSLRASITALIGHAAVPHLDPQDIEDAANATAWLALETARAGAGRFDSSQGTALAWVMRAAAFAYLDVARELARGSRRSVLSTVTQSDEIEQMLNELRQEDDPAEVVLGQDRVDRAFALLSEQERQALMLKIRGFSYEQSAAIIFRDPTCGRRIEHLLRRGRNKLRAAWPDLEAAGTVPGLDLQTPNDDKEADERRF